MVAQACIAAGLGAIIGWEREHHGSQSLAGVRTYASITLGACLFGLVSIYSAQQSVLGADPTRIAAQVVSGIGFIGTGVVFREGFRARGLTTAASLWVAAAVGLAVAYQLYIVAIVTTLLTFGLLFLSNFSWWRSISGKE